MQKDREDLVHKLKVSNSVDKIVIADFEECGYLTFSLDVWLKTWKTSMVERKEDDREK